MMAVMTAQPPLPLTLEGARPVGTAAAIVEDDAGGRVFVHGNLAYAWDVDDAAARRFAAVSLMRIKAATQLEVAEAFAVTPSLPSASCARVERPTAPSAPTSGCRRAASATRSYLPMTSPAPRKRAPQRLLILLPSPSPSPSRGRGWWWMLGRIAPQWLPVIRQCSGRCRCWRIRSTVAPSGHWRGLG